MLVIWDFYWFSLCCCRIAGVTTVLLAHVSSHHVAESQDGPVLRLRTLFGKDIVMEGRKHRRGTEPDEDRVSYMVVFGDFS